MPREQFLPDVDLETVYTRRQIVTKRDPSGAALSSASSPSLVADMLEQLAPQPGHRVLEIGAATGINAALLAELTSPGGTVVTIELDQDLADGARAGLDRAGYDTVKVICGDGALGEPRPRALRPDHRHRRSLGHLPPPGGTNSPTTAASSYPCAYTRAASTRCFAFDRTDPHQLVSTTTPLVCGFVPMRGSTEHTDHHVRLDTDVVLRTRRHRPARPRRPRQGAEPPPA